MELYSFFAVVCLLVVIQCVGLELILKRVANISKRSANDEAARFLRFNAYAVVSDGVCNPAVRAKYIISRTTGPPPAKNNFSQ